MKKRLFPLMLAVVICLSFGGCKKDQNDGEEPELQSAPDTSAATVQTQTEETTPPKDVPAEANVSFLGCGDNIVYYGNVREAAEAAAGTGVAYNFLNTYANVKDTVGAADISFINQEIVMCGNGYELSYYPKFNCPQEMGNNLVELGFDVINIANNHMLDQAETGLDATIQFWKTKNVLLTGGYTSEKDSDEIRIQEKNGMKIAFLSYTYGTNGLSCADDSGVWVPYLNEELVTRQVALAKEKADFIIASVHWGEENNFTITEDQKKYSQLFADTGVDAVIGHHPHVIQPVEWVKGKNGNQMLCVYSLGNFIGEMSHDYNMVGGIISFDIHRNGRDHPTIENVQFLPTVYYFNRSFYQNQIYFMNQFTEELAASHGIGYYENAMTLSSLQGYVSSVIDTPFLPANWK